MWEKSMLNMINDCFENNQNMRAGLKPVPTDGFPNNYAFYCSYRPTYDYVHNKTHDRYNETHDRASLRDFAHHNDTDPCRPHKKGRRPFIACDGSRFHNG